MTEAPERIWTQREFHQTSCRGSASTHETVRHAIGYIRADIHDAAVSAARKEGWNAGINAAADEAEEHKHFAKGIECCSACIRNMVKE